MPSVRTARSEMRPIWAHRLRWSIVATCIGLFCVIGYVGRQAYPGAEAVRLRNAFLIARSSPVVGLWEPAQAPPTFIVEQMPVPSILTHAINGVIPDPTITDLAKARAITSHLLTHVKDRGPIHDVDIEDTYVEIISQGKGYCADIIDAYIGLALAAGLQVRAWAFSFDGFGGYGHIVAEVFSRDTRRWVMLDVFNNVMPATRAAREPLSVREFLHVFRAHEDDVLFVPIGPGRPGFPIDEKLRSYYRRGIDQWYLWGGNNVVSRGNGNVLIASAGEVSQIASELIAIATGHYPGIFPLHTSTNLRHIESMFSLRTRLLAAGTIGCLLALALAIQIIVYWHSARRPVRSRR